MRKFSKLAAILAVCAFIFGGLLVSCSPHGTGYGLEVELAVVLVELVAVLEAESRPRPDQHLEQRLTFLR